MYTNLAIPVYIILSPVLSNGLIVNTTHFQFEPHIHSRLTWLGQFSFPVYYMYVEISVISA